MSVAVRARRPRAPPFLDPPGYGRHRPEATLLYQLIEQHYPAFCELRADDQPRSPLRCHPPQPRIQTLRYARLQQAVYGSYPHEVDRWARETSCPVFCMLCSGSNESNAE
jgi:hypothetical protein